MQLLVIRHAIAVEREDFARTGKDDRLRPLTDEGRKKMKQGAKGLRQLAPRIDLLATSPLTRAHRFDPSAFVRVLQQQTLTVCASVSLGSPYLRRRDTVGHGSGAGSRGRG